MQDDQKELKWLEDIRGVVRKKYKKAEKRFASGWKMSKLLGRSKRRPKRFLTVAGGCQSCQEEL